MEVCFYVEKDPFGFVTIVTLGQLLVKTQGYIYIYRNALNKYRVSKMMAIANVSAIIASLDNLSVTRKFITMDNRKLTYF